ncbi:MAG TPA: amidohydrolase family protein [Verrucomicrobiae bacterium]|nr:amidohydrolase family protein [Verrucomicrobiae bacterium]
MARKVQMVSGDSHLDFPPERWTQRVPAKWRDRAPRRIKLANGDDAFIIENRRPHSPSLQITGTGGAYDKHDINGVSYDGPGTGSPAQRLGEQDQDGVDAEILYTHPSYMSSWRGISDDEPYLALIRAYNSWLIEEYCSFAPDRLIAMGVIPDTGVNDAIAELEFCARAGYKGVCLYKFPSGKGYALPEDDRFWAAAVEIGMPVTAHTNGGTTRFSREGPVYRYSETPDRAAPGRDPVSLLVRFTSDNALAPLQLAFAGVFDRFPKLRVYWAETQVGWLPYCLSQIDDNYERNRYWAERDWGMQPFKCKPSEYLRERNLWGFMKDPLGVRLRHDVGVKALLWGSDFAHATGDWPESRRVIDETFVGVPAEERYAMLAGNAIEFFHLKDTVPEVSNLIRAA